MAITVDSFKFFFDRPAVMNAVDRYERSVLSRTGAWSQGAIKKRVKQGTGRERKGYKRKFPKYWGQRDGGLRKVLFAYDQSSATVVVGSLRFRNQTRRIRFKDRIFTTTPIGKTVPQLINEGGRARVTEI
ncbi:MAG: hypothetical protein ACPGLY_28210, partial [Rubripirellula sp.]